MCGDDNFEFKLDNCFTIAQVSAGGDRLSDKFLDNGDALDMYGQQLIDGQLIDLLSPQAWLQPIKC